MIELGLTSDEAHFRLAAHGNNELPAARPVSPWKTLSGAFREPMVALLLACSSIYFVLGQAHEGMLLTGSVFLITGITFYQAERSKRALSALRELSSPRAMVIRDGREVRLPARELVIGDVILLQEGDRVPADGTLVTSNYLRTDESLLTGESEPVTKTDSSPEQSRVYLGTLVVSGHGKARITMTGPATEMGKIGSVINASRPIPPTPLQKNIHRLVKRLAVLGLLFSTLIALAYGFTRGAWLEGVLAGLAAAMSLLPEEIPIVITVFLAMGAWRLSRKHVLTRAPAAIEKLGALTVLCVDKTGTLTQNQMQVQELVILSQPSPLSLATSQGIPESFHELVEFGALASHVKPFDPMDKALRQALENKLAGTEHVHDNWELVREYPLSHELLAMACVWRSQTARELTVAAKGAPEAIASLCRLGSPAAAQVAAQVAARVAELSERGLRVLAVARSTWFSPTLPDKPQDFEFRLLGLVGFADPIRPGTEASLRECKQAGIRVIMMTGDHLGTARFVARQIGLDGDDAILGSELTLLTDPELRQRMATVSIFARVKPDQKLRIIHALQARGEMVAMTGDGVNDAPSLMQADVGIAMGSRGTDVAREAADLVLLNDDFNSIVDSIRMGRRILTHFKNALSYIFSVHVPIAGLAILPVIFQWPLILFPVHIVFLEMIIDPASTLVFEAEPDPIGLMTRTTPASMSWRFSPAEMFFASLRGSTILVLALLAFHWMSERTGDIPLSRGTAFTVLVLSYLCLISLNRNKPRSIVAWRPRNPFFTAISAFTIALVLAVNAVPPLRDLFGFRAPNLESIGVILSGVTVFWFIGILSERWAPHAGRPETFLTRVET